MKEFAAAKLLILIIAVGCISSSSQLSSSLRNHAASKTAPSRKLEVSAGGSAVITSNTTSFMATLSRARQKAISGGAGGFIAGVIQVVTLMWLRTTVNYQYRYGVSMVEALRELYRQGGIYRFYRGLPYAIIQGPLARFGGVAANDAAIVFAAYLTSQPEQVSKGILSTALGSILAGSWRVFLMPIDTCKTVLQVDGLRGFKFLTARVRRGEISALYTGAIATIIATMASHYPWFIVHNILDKYLVIRTGAVGFLLRSATIGFCASAVSDTLSNSIRVVKTVKQATAGEYMSYRAVILKVHSESGFRGLFGRGLMTRILTNGLQSILFTVIWKLMARRDIEMNSAKGKDDVKKPEERSMHRRDTRGRLRQTT